MSNSGVPLWLSEHNKGWALVYFSTPECVSCPRARWQVIRLAQQYNVPLLEINAAAAINAHIVGEWDIQNVPTVVTCCDGLPIEKISVGSSVADVEAWLKAGIQ